MEKDAHYATVGLVSIGLTILLGLFIFWLAGAQFRQRYDLYDVAFEGPVRGLSTGGAVNFNGIKVGEVMKLTLNAKDPDRVDALIRVNSDTPIRTDSYAALEPQGVTGVNYIQITAGSRSKPLLRDTAQAFQVPEIPSRPSTLDSLLAGGGDVVTRAVIALDQVNKLLSEKNLREVSGTLADLHSVTSEIKRQEIIIGDLDTAVKSINETSNRIGALSEDSRRLVNGDGAKLVSNRGDVAAELKTTAAETHQLVADLRGPTVAFAQSGLPQVARAAASLQEASDSLDRLVRSLEANPIGAVNKPAARTVEIKP